MSAILMPCHWRTGSTLLKNTLVACGMKDCHEEFGRLGELDGIGVHFYYKGFDRGLAYKVPEILRDFREKAIAAGFENYGIKVNHLIQFNCWADMGRYVFTEWPDAKFVISIRHPAEIVRSIDKLREKQLLDPPLPAYDIVRSWESTWRTSELLCKYYKAITVVYPDSWMDGNIENTVHHLGLKWTEEARALFKSADVASEKEKSEFDRKRPLAANIFRWLKEYRVLA